MTLVCMLRLMIRYRDKGHVHLQRRIGQAAQKLQFRVFLQRHEIQNTHLQRTDFLAQRPAFVHDKNILFLQYLFRRQIILNSNRHYLHLVSLFIPASNEPSGHAGMSIWRLPRGSNTPMLASPLI